MLMEADTQKAISEDETKSLQERLMAYRQYAQLSFQAQEAPISAQYDQAQESLAAIEKIEAKSADKRTQQEKDLMARKAVIIQQFNDLSAQYDLIRAQDIDTTAKGIIAIPQDETKTRLDAVKDLSENVDAQGQDALKVVSDALKAGTIDYDEATKQKKAIEDKFQKDKQQQIVDYLQGEINDLASQGVITISLQQQLNAALKNLYDVDAQNAPLQQQRKKLMRRRNYRIKNGMLPAKG